MNPFLTEIIVDEILGELSVDELKEFRQVCNLWDEISVKFLSKHDFGPVEFNRKTAMEPYEEVAHLDALLNGWELHQTAFFHSFKMTLNQIEKIANSGILTHFGAYQIEIFHYLDDERNFEKTHLPILPSLIQPITSTLRELTLDLGRTEKTSLRHRLPSDYPIEFIFAWGKCEGLTLKKLDLKGIYLEELNLEEARELTKCLSELLRGQAPTLEDLTIGLNAECTSFPDENDFYDNFKISLPIFPKLLTLNYNIMTFIPFYYVDPPGGNDFWKLILPFDFNINFPKLQHLIIGYFDESEDALIGAFRITRGHPLKSLTYNIYDTRIPLPELFRSFPLLEDLNCVSFLLQTHRLEYPIPWAETLTKLTLQRAFNNTSPCDIRHLTRLEHFIVNEGMPDNTPIIFNDENFQGFLASIESFRYSNLKIIEFNGLSMSKERVEAVQASFPDRIQINIDPRMRYLAGAIQNHHTLSNT